MLQRRLCRKAAVKICDRSTSRCVSDPSRYIRSRAQKAARWHVAVKSEQLKSDEGLTHHCSALPSSLHRAADTGGWQTRSIRSVMPTRSWKRGIAARKVRTHRHHTPRHQVRHRPDTPALVATNTATTPAPTQTCQTGPPPSALSATTGYLRSRGRLIILHGQARKGKPLTHHRWPGRPAAAIAAASVRSSECSSVRSSEGRRGGAARIFVPNN